MSKGSKRKTPFAAAGQRQAAANPFEALHSKKKFNVIGRTSGGSQKNVNQRRKTLLVEYKQLKKANAFVDRRFGEYDEGLTEDEKAIARFQKERLRKARTSKFTLAEEEPEAGGDALTHLGNPLSALDDFKDSVPRVDDDDEDGGVIDDAFVRDFHFGGGGAAGGAEDQQGTARKTKREVMAEVIGKSKAGKAEKRLQREGDEELLESLDKTFEQLQRDPVYRQLKRAVGENKGVRQTADNDEDAAYDVTRREMAFESRAKATDREATAEELLEKEQARLAKLERARLRRMEGGYDDNAEDDDDDDDDEDGAPAGGFARRRALARKEDAKVEQQGAQQRAPGDSAEAEDDFEDADSGDSGADSGEDDDEDAQGGGQSALDARRAARAAGDHPLQKDFRALTASILLKHGVQPTKQSLGDLEGLGEDESGSDDVDGESEEEDAEDGSGLDASSGDSSMDTDAEEGVMQEVEAAERLLAAAGTETGPSSSSAVEESDSGSESEVDSGDEDSGEEDAGKTEFMAMLNKAIAIKRAEAGASNGSALREDSGVARAKPLEGPTPSAGKRSKADMAEEEPAHPTKRAKAEARRRNLPAATRPSENGAAAAAANEKPLDSISYTPPIPQTQQEFAAMVQGRSGPDVAVVVQRIRAFNAHALGADSKVALQGLYGVLMQHFSAVAGEAPLRRDVLDALAPILATMAAEVPLYAATVARAQLAAMFRRFSHCLQSPSSASSAWPGTRGVLLMQLQVTLFPASDRKHPVCTPLTLLIGYLLSVCPPSTPHDIATALLLASLLQRMAAAGGRYAPEVTPLCEALLHGAVPAAHRSSEQALCAGHLRLDQAWLAHAAASGQHDPAAAPLDIWGVLSRPASDPYFVSAAFRSAALCTVLGLVRGQVDALQGCSGLPGAILPLQRALRAFVEHGKATVPSAVLAQATDLLHQTDAAEGECVAARKPLVCAALERKAPQRLLNPRFEMDFDKRRDYDPDRERAEFKQYKRMAAKEQRSLKRELTRDAAFMGEVRRKDKVAAANARDKTQKKAIAFLQQQESDFKSGGQGGMNPHRKKGKTAR